MNKQNFDYIIIGAGSAGFAAAIVANQLGAKTALINAGLALGGTCINVGCVPSKTLLHIGQIYYDATKRITPAINFEKVSFDFQKAIKYQLSLVKKMQKLKYKDVLKNLQKVSFFRGKAKFINPHQVIIAKKQLSADKFLICSGSTAVHPPIPGLDKINFLTHIEALKMKKLPKSLIVIGGGAIALEFAQMYSHFGSQVTILQRSRILKQAEPELSKELVMILRKEGIKIIENVEFLEAGENKTLKFVKVRIKGSGKEKIIIGQALLVGTGKKPNTKYLNLEKAGVKTEKNSAIKVNKMMQTTNKAIYAAGDVVLAPKRLETTAAKEGHIATLNALTSANKKITYFDIPSVVFTTPAVASVGLTDKQAINKGVDCNCTTIPFELVPKATIIGDTRGLIKMVIDNKSKKGLGIHILSRHAEELIHQAVLVVKLGLTLDDIRQTVYVFPTLSEAIKLAATSFDKDITKLSCCVE